MLLGMFLREKGQIFSHSLHDVAGVEDGTIRVQRGHSLALNVQEGLSPWEGLLIRSSIMGDAFDILHVKDWSHVLMGAYLHGPIKLSPWSRGLWMKYVQWKCGELITHRSQDHFTLDAPDE